MKPVGKCGRGLLAARTKPVGRPARNVMRSISGRDSVEPTKENCGRDNPATGVYRFPGNPTIVFLTVCTFQRQTGLANQHVMNALAESWKTADSWSVGHFLLMPDHLHLFCAPKREEFSIEQWIPYWKRQVRRVCPSTPRFQSRGFHHRLRKGDSYEDRLQYVLNNPVRAGLVKTPDEWAFQGKLNDLSWR